MILEAYFDDSSDEHREKYYSCGGILGNEEQWDLFEPSGAQKLHI
jgi:hypothetical protein